MGARINFVFKDGTDSSVVLYSHWGQDSWQPDIAEALQHARRRWDDSSYGTRMVISYLIQHNILDEQIADRKYIVCISFHLQLIYLIIQ